MKWPDSFFADLRRQWRQDLRVLLAGHDPLKQKPLRRPRPPRRRPLDHRADLRRLLAKQARGAR